MANLKYLWLICAWHLHYDKNVVKVWQIKLLVQVGGKDPDYARKNGWGMVLISHLKGLAKVRERLWLWLNKIIFISLCPDAHSGFHHKNQTHYVPIHNPDLHILTFHLGTLIPSFYIGYVNHVMQNSLLWPYCRNTGLHIVKQSGFYSWHILKDSHDTIHTVYTCTLIMHLGLVK